MDWESLYVGAIATDESKQHDLLSAISEYCTYYELHCLSLCLCGMVSGLVAYIPMCTMLYSLCMSVVQVKVWMIS